MVTKTIHQIKKKGASKMTKTTITTKITIDRTITYNNQKSKKTYTQQQKEEILKKYFQGTEKKEIIKTYNIPESTLNNWIRNYKKEKQQIKELNTNITNINITNIHMEEKK